MAETDARKAAGGGRGSAGEAAQMSRAEAIEYIAALLDGLRLVAHNAQLPFLAYLIAVALEEAKSEKVNRA